MEAQSIHEHHIRNESLFKRGETVALVKREILNEKASEAGVGNLLFGKLQEDIEVGKSIDIEWEGRRGNTSAVRRITINETTGRILVITQTSKYELLDKSFRGLDLETEFGSVHLPIDSQLVRLDNGIVDFSLPTKDKKYRIYINKPLLKGTLLESEGAQIFRAMQGRLFVLAKVRNIHLPFYISSQGTSGKNEGDWYPFFGYNNWIVKGGNIDPSGKMSYNPEVDKVTELLNRNLILPAKYISLKGKIGYQIVGNEPTFVIFDLNNHLLYKPYTFSSDKSDTQFVEDITGYSPKPIIDHDSPNVVTPWINSILKGIN